MTKKPSYRFAGYAESWEQKKLGDFSDVTKLAGFEFTNHVKYSSTGSIIALRGLNIKNGNIILNDVKYIDESDFSKLHRSKLIINDIMFTYVGTVGELAVIEDNNKFYLAPNVSRIRILNDTYPYFLMQYMWRKSFYQSVIFPLIATSSQPALSMENIRKFNISLPSLPEQTAIGSFFQDIDHLITLQQRKLEVLKEQKKTYLKLLFSAKGQTKPALRFAGFEDEWKEVKLGEIIQSISSKNYITEYYEEGNNPVIQQGDIPIVGFSDNKPFNNFSNVILFGDHTLSLFKPETPFLLATDGIKILHSDLTTQPFLFIMLERYLPKSQGYKRHYSLLKNELSSLPSLPEQEVIGSFFQDLDKAIAKQEEKVNQLKESKQTLLRKMFI